MKVQEDTLRDPTSPLPFHGFKHLVLLQVEMNLDERGSLMCVDTMLGAAMKGIAGIGFRMGTGISEYVESCAMC
jgi:hypothetical protein